MPLVPTPGELAVAEHRKPTRVSLGRQLLGVRYGATVETNTNNCSYVPGDTNGDCVFDVEDVEYLQYF